MRSRKIFQIESKTVTEIEKHDVENDQSVQAVE